MNKTQSVFPSKQPPDKGKAEAVPARAVCTGTLEGSAPLSSQPFVPYQLCSCLAAAGEGNPDLLRGRQSGAGERDVTRERGA